MLYTGKGDNGDTTHPAVDKRVSKTDPVIEALGSVDELNAWIGYCRVKAAHDAQKLLITNYQLPVTSVLHAVQQDLFIIQAELVGMKKLEAEKVKTLEQWIAAIEAELPPITTFFLPGGTELSAMLDIARTICRRAERNVVRIYNPEAKLRDGSEAKLPMGSLASGQYPAGSFASGQSAPPNLLAYLNRLSSLYYALSRWLNHRAGIAEEPPSYR